jgi:hypothetical protein
LYVQVTGGLIEQLNPTTGAVINSRSTGGLDGLTFDPVTGALWAGSGTTLEKISLDLSTVSTFTCPICAFIDGVESDGSGNIAMADANGGKIVQFAIGTSTFTSVASTPGIDDLAPLTGGGAPPVPEPSTLSLLGIGLVGILGFTSRLRAHSRPAK